MDFCFVLMAIPVIFIKKIKKLSFFTSCRGYQVGGVFHDKRTETYDRGVP